MRSTHLLVPFLSLLPTIAFAQEAAPPPPPPAALPPPPPVHREREGLELALGLQGGKIFCEGQMGQCDGFTEAGGGNITASWFFSPTLGIALDFWAMSHSDNGFTFTHYVNTVALRWRPLPIVTLTGGIGAAHASLSLDNSSLAVNSDDAFAIMGAASIDVIRGRRWALALEARFGNGFYGDDDNDGMADVVGRNVGAGAHFAVFGF
ncbi:MAG TPA: hypothetical protein VFV99_28000 [Kofleriaceae bacterium]|nr:hypothetical protein [Kofleriaceae bacterium]